MESRAPAPTYTFVNPNTPEQFQEAIRKILIDRLLALHRDREKTAG